MARVGWFLVLWLLAACNPGPHDIQFDASPDGSWTPTCTAPGPTCTETCGNQQVDWCYAGPGPGNHCTYYRTQEPCDGTTTTTCADLGYYGGSTACTDCNIDESACDVCAPSATCGTFDRFASEFELAASGSRVAVIGDSDVAIFDATTRLSNTPLDPWPMALAPTPSGWLVGTFAPALIPVDLSGNAGTSQAFPVQTTYMQLAASSGGRVLALWDELVGSAPGVWHIFYAIFDGAGNVVVPRADLIAEDDTSRYAAASDGTNYFVPSLGTLSRVAPDGVASMVSGFPVQGAPPDYAYVTWSGTNGWYISGPVLVAQRFDASGNRVGGPVTLDIGGAGMDFVADGNDLLVLRGGTKKLDVVRVDSTGTVVATTPVGGGSYGRARMTRVGTNLFVGWSTTQHFQVAVVTP